MRGSRILQGRASNPRERDTRGRALKGKGPGVWEGAVPPAQKCMYFLYQNGEFSCITGNIYWHCNCINGMFWTYIYQKGHPNPKSG